MKYKKLKGLKNHRAYISVFWIAEIDIHLQGPWVEVSWTQTNKFFFQGWLNSKNTKSDNSMIKNIFTKLFLFFTLETFSQWMCGNLSRRKQPLQQEW